MKDNRVRKRGILLVVSRIDRNWVKETWLYKLERVDVPVYDPSPPEIQSLLSKGSKKSKEKFDTIMTDLCTLRKVNKFHRRKGKDRRDEKGLKTSKSVDLYIKKKLHIKKKKKRKMRKGKKMK